MAKSKILNPLELAGQQVAELARKTLNNEAGKLQAALGLAPAEIVVAPSSRLLPQLSAWKPRALASNPGPVQEEEDEEGDDDDDDLPAAFFALGDADTNLACAVGAYRCCGGEDQFVAQHKDGSAFFGVEEQLAEHCSRHGQNEDDWDMWADPDEILEMEYDRAGIAHMMRLLDEQEGAWENAKKQHEGFHWGDKANAVGLVQIPGVQGPAMYLGIAKRIEYAAQKEGAWQEYFHEHGEESGLYPSIYGIGEPNKDGHYVAYVVHGGNMHIEDRGIID